MASDARRHDGSPGAPRRVRGASVDTLDSDVDTDVGADADTGPDGCGPCCEGLRLLGLVGAPCAPGECSRPRVLVHAFVKVVEGVPEHGVVVVPVKDNVAGVAVRSHPADPTLVVVTLWGWGEPPRTGLLVFVVPRVGPDGLAVLRHQVEGVAARGVLRPEDGVAAPVDVGLQEAMVVATDGRVVATTAVVLCAVSPRVVDRGGALVCGEEVPLAPQDVVVRPSVQHVFWVDAWDEVLVQCAVNLAGASAGGQD